MAPGAKITNAPSSTKPQTPNPKPNNVPSSDPILPAAAAAAVNKKKQKRRQKQAAKDAVSHDPQLDANDDPDLDSGDLASPQISSAAPYTFSPTHSNQRNSRPAAADSKYFEPANETDFAYSDDENHATYHHANGSTHAKANKKKKKGNPAQFDLPYNPAYPHNFTHPPQPPPPPPPPISDEALRTVQRKVSSKDPIWDSSTHEERARIKEFWLSLGEDDRKSLVKIEKEAVLRKMKEQQKHSCSCTVCGRKRTAIEEELEVLYDAYYDELEQYANRNPDAPNGRPLLSPNKIPIVNQTHDRYSPMSNPRRPARARIQEISDEEKEDDDGLPPDEDGDEDDYSDEDYDQDYSGDDTDELPPRAATDFFTFGNSLTVQGGILTVADDLLKNDGKKFIDMMEQLAERRIQREEEAQFPPYRPAHPAMPPPHSHAGHNHPPPEEEEEYDDEDEEFDSQDEEYDEEDEMDTMTEEQRMEEGRRMFQIFAARMFEQRVLTAYRERVARERQQRLIEELEAESLADTQRDAKKARDAEKKKLKKQQQKHAKAAEKALKDEQKAAEEAAVRDAEIKKQEEQKRKKEEQRKKKEAERKAAEEDKQRKEADKQRRLVEEREKQQDIERKAREAKVEEKRRREESRKKTQDEKDAKDQAARDKKGQEEREKRDLQRPKTSFEADEQRQSDGTFQPGHQSVASEPSKRPAIPAAIVALPPSLKSQKSNVGQPSPVPKVATPVVPPKIPSSTRPRDTSSSNTQPSTSHTPETSTTTTQPTVIKSSATQPSMNPVVTAPSRAPARVPQMPYSPQLMQMSSNGPPPGMQHGPGQAFGNMPPVGMNGFPGSQAPMMHGMAPGMPMNRQMPMYASGNQMNFNGRGFMHPQHAGPPHTMSPAMMQGSTRNFQADSLSSYQHTPTTSGPPSSTPSHSASTRDPVLAHSRQPSASFDLATAETTTSSSGPQPIARPAPIKRPASTKPLENLDKIRTINTEVDDLSNHLGSSALLDDSDVALPKQENRRPSAAPGMPSSAGSGAVGSPFEQYATHHIGRAPPSGSWQSPNGFGPSSIPNTPGWGNASSNGWGGTGSLHVPHQRSSNSRPVTVRLLACQTCKRLSAHRPGNSFHDIGEVIRGINASQPPNDAPIQMNELQLILDTEGDTHNGGGSFAVDKDSNNRMLVRWEADMNGQTVHRAMSGLGEIGKPLHSVGGGRGF